MISSLIFVVATYKYQYRYKWVYERRYLIFYTASDKLQYFAGKLLRGNCIGSSSSIQLLAGFTAYLISRISRKLNSRKYFMFYSLHNTVHIQIQTENSENQEFLAQISW